MVHHLGSRFNPLSPCSILSTHSPEPPWPVQGHPSVAAEEAIPEAEDEAKGKEDPSKDSADDAQEPGNHGPDHTHPDDQQRRRYDVDCNPDHTS